MAIDHAWPSGAVTFLLTDIEDSTPLWDRHRAAMRPALAEHDALLKTAVDQLSCFTDFYSKVDSQAMILSNSSSVMYS